MEFPIVFIHEWISASWDIYLHFRCLDWIKQTTSSDIIIHGATQVDRSQWHYYIRWPVCRHCFELSSPDKSSLGQLWLSRCCIHIQSIHCDSEQLSSYNKLLECRIAWCWIAIAMPINWFDHQHSHLELLSHKLPKQRSPTRHLHFHIRGWFRWCERDLHNRFGFTRSMWSTNFNNSFNNICQLDLYTNWGRPIIHSPWLCRWSFILSRALLCVHSHNFCGFQ